MGILEDVIKALERVPGWKRISGLPSEVDALRQRVAALEARLTPTTGDMCPRCRAMTFKLAQSRPDPGPFGALGAMQDVHRCSSCHYERIDNRDPA